MAEQLRKFVTRAPRYVLRPGDDQILRFAHQDEKNKSFTTRFLNISETGIAFLVDRSCLPLLGDQIKVEFPVPGGEQVAWFARVVRMEEVGTEDVMVGIHFSELPEGHKNLINQALSEKLLEILREQRKESLKSFLQYFIAHYGKVTLYIICSLLAFGLLYLLSLPTENYDPEKGGTLWGNRFKFWF